MKTTHLHRPFTAGFALTFVAFLAGTFFLARPIALFVAAMVLLCLLHFVACERDTRRAARRQAESEARLISQTRLLTSVLDDMGDGVLVMDRDRTLLMANPAAKRLFGEALAARLPSDWTELVRARFAPDQQLSRTRRGLSCGRFAVRLRTGWR